MKKIKWVEDKGMYQGVTSGFVGRIRLFSYAWNIAQKIDSNKNYVLNCVLLPNKRFYFENPEQCKKHATILFKGICNEIL